ncbi:MAG: hypothetical protein REI09_06825, partial [Candidatus Dactylopiibacterium sp.]|nr:hypothetical protein [Candidatus Dactylopiibacterium sp.]
MADTKRPKLSLPTRDADAQPAERRNRPPLRGGANPQRTGAPVRRDPGEAPRGFRGGEGRRPDDPRDNRGFAPRGERAGFGPRREGSDRPREEGR